MVIVSGMNPPVAMLPSSVLWTLLLLVGSGDISCNGKIVLLAIGISSLMSGNISLGLVDSTL